MLRKPKLMDWVSDRRKSINEENLAIAHLCNLKMEMIHSRINRFGDGADIERIEGELHSPVKVSH